MSTESLYSSISHIDFSIDKNVEATARKLLGNPEDTKETRERARQWINSSAKSVIERMGVGLIGSIVATPVSLGARVGVRLSDGADTLYDLEVGFLGMNGETVNHSTITKVRSFRRGVDKTDAKKPLGATAFIGGRKKAEMIRDSRVHSNIGHLIRRTGVDEFPQVPNQVLRGSMAGIGPRAYTMTELEGLKALFMVHDEQQPLFPEEQLHGYRQTISEVRPKPGFFGLYTAIYRKRLTISERLMLDNLYCTFANPMGDLRIIKASISTIRKGVGAS